MSLDFFFPVVFFCFTWLQVESSSAGEWLEADEHREAGKKGWMRGNESPLYVHCTDKQVAECIMHMNEEEGTCSPRPSPPLCLSFGVKVKQQLLIWRLTSARVSLAAVLVCTAGRVRHDCFNLTGGGGGGGLLHHYPLIFCTVQLCSTFWRNYLIVVVLTSNNPSLFSLFH